MKTLEPGQIWKFEGRSGETFWANRYENHRISENIIKLFPGDVFFVLEIDDYCFDMKIIKNDIIGWVFCPNPYWVHLFSLIE